MLERLRIVLARPIRGGNVGSVCRAMMNFGLSDLVLVAPACDPLDNEAQTFATRARPMLSRARVAPSLADAMRDCVATIATSGKAGFHRRRAVVSPREGAAWAVEMARRGPVAIAFGPEDRGLVEEEILEFDRVMEIPTSEEYAAMNLAAAVAVVAYELRQAWLAAGGVAPITQPDPAAPDEQKRVMYEKLYAALERIGFFRRHQNPDHLKYALRRVFGRAGLTVKEVDVLIGMAQQIKRLADGPRAETEADTHQGPPPTGEMRGVDGDF